MTTILGSFRFVFVWFGQFIKYLYLSRVALVGLLLLWALPLMAVGALRTLVIGAYDLSSFGEALLVGLALCAVVASVFVTARIVWDLAGKRYDLDLESFAPTIQWMWTVALVLAVALNVVIAVRVSSREMWWKVLAGLLSGIALAKLLGRLLSWIQDRLGRGSFRKILLRFMTRAGLHTEGGFVILNARGEPQDIEAGHTSALAYALMLAVLYAVLVHLNIPALVTVLMVVALCVLVLAAATFFFDYYRVPLLLGILAYCALMARWWQNDHYYRVWPLPANAVTEMLTPRAVVLEAMRQNRPIVVVASAGGGIQATAWTTATLSRIGEELKGIDFPGSIRLISGVSGGSVGGLFYAMAVDLPGNDRFEKADEAAEDSGLGQAMRGLLRDDLVRALAPFVIFNGSNFPMGIYADRGHELEMAWVDNAEKRFPGASGLSTATLSRWGADALALRRPALVFNSTMVETGERFALSTVPASRSNVGSCEFTQRYKADIAMTTAARLSATFPLISPTARPGPSRDAKAPGYSLPGPEFWALFPRGGNYLHAVDGGYYENSGIVGAVEWLDDAFTEMVRRNEPLPAQVLFLELNAFPLQAPIDETQPAPPDTPAIDTGQRSHGTLYDLISPLPAIINVRNSGQKAFATRVLELFRARWARESGRSVNIVPVRFYYDFDPALGSQPIEPGGIFVGPDPYRQPLSWHLRPCEKEDIKAHLKNLGKSDEFATIKGFFESR
jgi:hypothetical protein